LGLGKPALFDRPFFDQRILYSKQYASDVDPNSKELEPDVAVFAYRPARSIY